MTQTLACPSCARLYPGSERFCPDCRMPLVRASDLAVPGDQLAPTGSRDWARRVKPQLADGELVRVAGARNQTEAEFIQGMLLEEGVPSVLRRTAGFDVPDFLAAGPRDVLVPESGVATARDVLLQADPLGAPSPGPSPARLAAGLAIGLVVVVLVIILGTVVFR